MLQFSPAPGCPARKHAPLPARSERAQRPSLPLESQDQSVFARLCEAVGKEGKDSEVMGRELEGCDRMQMTEEFAGWSRRILPFERPIARACTIVTAETPSPVPVEEDFLRFLLFG